MNLEYCEDNDVSMVENPLELSMCDLVEEYQKVYRSYLRQKAWIDKYRQEIHVLKQDKALKESILEDGLQTISENYDLELADNKKKYLHEIEDLNNRLSEANINIQKLERENEYLKISPNDAVRPLKNVCPESKVCKENEIVVTIERIRYLEKLEDDFSALSDELMKIESEKSQIMSHVKFLEVRTLCFLYFRLFSSKIIKAFTCTYYYSSNWKK